MARLIFKPFSLITSVIAGRLAGKLFGAIWAKADDEAVDGPPSPTRADVSLRRAAAGKMLHAATFAGTRAVADRAQVRAIYHLTGLWTGDKPPKDKNDDEVPADA